MKGRFAGLSLYVAGMLMMFGCWIFPIAGYGQQTDKEAAMRTFESRDYGKAVALFKKLTKANGTDAESWYMLGMSYYKQHKNKDSVKAFERAVELAPRDAMYQLGLAYAYLAAADGRAKAAATKVIEIDPQQAPAYYLLGILAYRAESFNTAYEYARRSIQIDPNYPAPYRLKSRVLVSSYLALRGKVLPPGSRTDLMPEAASDLEKFLSLTTDEKLRRDLQAELEDMKYYANYYSLPENREVTRIAGDTSLDPTKTGLKILKKPLPSYTDNARNRNAQGTVILLVAFDASGKIGPIMVTKSLDIDLDREAVIAARKIKFIPATRNAIPVTSLRQVEYTFSIY